MAIEVILSDVLVPVSEAAGNVRVGAVGVVKASVAITVWLLKLATAFPAISCNTLPVPGLV